nr:reverse transcriptase domain-containing protein [Tanacetum cinerariifolium]
MADQRTMAQLIQAPTEGYEDAIVIPAITADNFELKHGLLTLVQNKQFFEHDKEDPHAHVRYFNKITSTLKFLNVPNTKSPDAVTTILPTEEPEYSLSMGYEHLSTTPETELDEVTESSAKNLLPIPSECEVTSEDESECDVPAKDKSSSVFMTFSIPLFDDNDDLTSSDDESLFEEEVPIKEFKIYSNPLFDDDEINFDMIDPHHFNFEYEFVESLSNRDTLIESSLMFDYLEEFSGAFMPTRIADEELQDGDSQREEIDIFTNTDELLPPSIENEDDDSEEDIHFLEELLSDDSILLPENESSDSDHQNDSLFSHPHPEPPDAEFDFDPGGEINVYVEDDDYFPFIFVIRIFLPYFIFPEAFPLFLSAESEDTIFVPGFTPSMIEDSRVRCVVPVHMSFISFVCN